MRARRRVLRRSPLVVVAAVLAGCLAAHRGSSVPTRVEHWARSVPEAPIVVVVAIDGVRWQDVVNGPEPRRLHVEHAAPRVYTPVLHALLTGDGAFLGGNPGAASLDVSGPHFVSLPGYSEMLGGRSPSDCADNSCRAAKHPTLLDQLATEHPGDVAVFTSWPDIGKVVAHDPERLVSSTGRHGGRHLELLEQHPELRGLLEAGRQAKPGPGHGDFRPDRYTAKLALAYLAVVARAAPRP